MTKSEDIADEYFYKKERVKWQKNGWPDRWRWFEEEGRLRVREYKYGNKTEIASLLNFQQRLIREVLIKHGIHYQLIAITRKWEVIVAFDSDLHKIQ